MTFEVLNRDSDVVHARYAEVHRMRQEFTIGPEGGRPKLYDQ